MIDGEEAGGDFSLVEHPMPHRALAAPLHRHTREDEYSVVLEGRLGAPLGDEVVYGEPGDLIFKPRDQWHRFWNAGDEPARLLEIISPAGFEDYFKERTELPEGPPDAARIAEIAGRYGLELDFESIRGSARSTARGSGPPPEHRATYEARARRASRARVIVRAPDGWPPWRRRLRCSARRSFRCASHKNS